MGMETVWGTGVLFAIVFYTLCSSLMLIANKVAMFFNPLPATLITLQVVVTVGYILCLRALNLSEVDAFEWSKVKVFCPYIVSFVLVLYSNGRAIEFSNIETVIVFRAGTPLLVSVLDYAFLGRELPNKRSLAALLGMAIAVIGYAETDSDFQLRGLSAYGWVTLYVLSVVFETTYGKRICQGIKFNAPVWGQVMYTNALGLFPMLGVAFISGEVTQMKKTGFDVGTKALLAITVTCFIGVGIAWSVWNCRNQVSATLYTVIGVVCKLISVLINVFIWDKHASALGIFFLVVCLGCSSVYRQAPLRSDAIAQPPAASEKHQGTDEEMANILGNVDDEPEMKKTNDQEKVKDDSS